MTISFNELPVDWRDKAEPVSEGRAEQLRKLWRNKPKSIIIEDDCGLELSIAVIDGDMNVFRITDPALTARILRSSTVAQPLQMLYLARNTVDLRAMPKTNKGPSLN